MQARAGNLAHRSETIDGGASAIIGHHAAATVVCCGDYRNRLAGEVDATLNADGVDSGEALAEPVGWFVGDVQIDARLT